MYVCVCIHRHTQTHLHIHMHTHTMEYYSVTRKEILPFVTAHINFEGIMLSEISHTGEDKYHAISLICETKKYIQVLIPHTSVYVYTHTHIETHRCHIIISTEFKEKHTLEQDELFCCVIISSGLKESLEDCCPNNSEFKEKNVLCD